MSQPAKPWSMARVVTASSAGTAFEWYDFFIFGSLTPVIAKVFLAGLDPTSALIAALALFAVGFAFRPLGAIIFGAMGDRVGRKATFLTTVSLMGGATFAIGLLPTYEQVGMLAPILLVLLRICQGTALGGEYGGAAIYVAEHAANDRRGAATGWIQSSASFGLLAALLIIFGTRTWLGEEAFGEWGWRIPFLLSVILLAISVWMRMKLSESPHFAKLQEEGEVSKTPLREAFARRDSLRKVAIAFFGIMCAQGAVWYFSFFYMQVFLEKSLGIPGATKDMLLIVMTVVSAPLYVFFGWLSDRDRAQAGDAGRNAAGAGALFPGIAPDRPGGKPGAGRCAGGDAGDRRNRPGNLFGAVRSDRHGQVRHRLRHRQECAGQPRRRLFDPGFGRRPDPGRRRSQCRANCQRRRPVRRGLKALKAKSAEAINAELAAAGYPTAADPTRIHMPLLIAVLLLFVVAATALYGPQAAALVEMFPTRIRYTAMSLPYHVGTGWVGGFLPVTSFAIVALTGDIYAGLWYAVAFTALSAVVTIFFLKETHGKPLEEC